MRTWKFWLVANLVLSACIADPRLDGFVREFVISVYENSEFHRAYTVDSNDPILATSREYMTDVFEIVGYDYFGPGQYEYRIEFSNGASGLATVILQGTTVVSVRLDIRAPPFQQPEEQ
jgi:hypothetical protein